MKMHPSKCKVQTNEDHWGKRGMVDLDDGFSVKILEVGKGLISGARAAYAVAAPMAAALL